MRHFNANMVLKLLKVRKVFQLLHTIYTIFWFVISFLMLFPFFLIFSLTKKWHHLAYKLNHLWAIIYFPLCFFKTEIQFEGVKLNANPVIYCANHFSAMDIPSLALLPKQACYVGKESIAKLPLFGYMFKTLHITVNRGSFRDKGRAFQKYKGALNQGKSLFIYAEGGIKSTNIPEQANYKDGAFKVAIEQKIPIVPITISNNWKVLPDGDWLIKDNFIKIIVHKPIITSNLSSKDTRQLKEKVRSLIQCRINTENNIVSDRQELESTRNKAIS